MAALRCFDKAIMPGCGGAGFWPCSGAAEPYYRFSHFSPAMPAGLNGFFHRLLTDSRSHRRVMYDGVMIVLVLNSVIC